MTFLVCNHEPIPNNEYKFIGSNKTISSCYTNKRNAKKGKWYFEISNKKDESNKFLVAWEIKDIGYFGYYPRWMNNEQYFYCYSHHSLIKFINEKNEYFNYFPLKFDDETADDTAGIGFDFESRNIYLRIKENVRILRMFFNTTKTIEIQPFIFEIAAENIEDTISANFGQKSFEYDVPFGFQPWGSPLKVASCKGKRKSFSLGYSFVMLSLYS